MLHWVKYFLVGVEQTASHAVQTLSNVLKFKDGVENIIRATYGNRSTNAIRIIHQLLQNPFITIDEAARLCSI